MLSTAGDWTPALCRRISSSSTQREAPAGVITTSAEASLAKSSTL
ncbi:MAG: hypothetical protein AVDCRST_MAG26-2879 [uncultured Chloroflexia bacterium]|uniref:Uncharacterized protein n=1 Tax=uncultured Chloroflexia bacterium TaxID=1672391 RepID=A0A6J4J6V5_9CHLR|nr:MAG: hypothetical protein AVDCRST_MAG26-2879 [uncultured Chloroflexia bacterium]